MLTSKLTLGTAALASGVFVAGVGVDACSALLQDAGRPPAKSKGKKGD